jgi:predicted flap endonuclease-1-like 5' DNA nuclease
MEWIFLLVIVVLVVLIWWWLRRPEEKEVPAATLEPAPPPLVVEAPGPDDLTRIEGIGPKISSLLQAAGIITFAQLAEIDVGRLEEILTEADLSGLADPSTWPEQAWLAASEQWDELETLQEELKGGRRV